MGRMIGTQLFGCYWLFFYSFHCIPAGNLYKSRMYIVQHDVVDALAGMTTIQTKKSV